MAGGYFKGIVAAVFSQLFPNGLQHPFRFPGGICGCRKLGLGIPAIFTGGEGQKLSVLQRQFQPYVYFPHGSGCFYLPLKGGTDVPVQAHSFLQPGRFLAADGETFTDIGPEASSFESESVSVGQDEAGRGRLQDKAVRGKAQDRTYEFSASFSSPLAAFPIQEQLRIAAVEGFVEVRNKTAPDVAEGSAAVMVRIAVHQGVQGLRIGSDHIPHIRLSLEPPFNFEGIHPCIGQFFQPVQQVIILQGEKGFVSDQRLAACIFQVVQAPAGLGAGSPVGASAGEVF